MIKRKLILVVVINFSLLSAGCWSDHSNMKDELDFLEMISFSGRPEDKIKVVSLLDKALKEQGDLGVYGDLSCGVEELLKDSYISITDNEEFYGIAVSPKSGAGHDFSFDVDRKSGEISNVVVGVVVPPPGV